MHILLCIFLSLLTFNESHFINKSSSIDFKDSLNYIFTSSRSGKQEIWKKEGATLVQLTKDKKLDSWRARISPDGTKILFYRSVAGSKSNTTDIASLWLMNADGSNQVKLIDKGEYGWHDQSGANWSPDGTKLIMAASTEKNGSNQLYITDLNGKNPKTITHRAGYFFDPAFSKDGSQIAYVALPEDYSGSNLGRLELFVMDSTGRNEFRLTYDEFRDHEPCWSPSGKQLVFETATKPGNLITSKWGLRTIASDGGDPTNILFDDHTNTSPRWINEKIILFQRIPYLKTQAHLFLVNSDGANLVDLTNGKAEDKEPDIIR